MPEYDDDQMIEDDTLEESEGVRGIRKAKKAAEDRAEKAEAELAQAAADRRELAAMKAGLDPANKTAAFFLAHYDGDLSAEAMKAAAVEAGIIDDGTAQADTAAQGQSQMADAFGGGEIPNQGVTQIGPPGQRQQVPAEEAAMWSDFEKAIKSGPMGFQKAGDILRQAGHEVGAGQAEPLNTNPNVTPLANQANRIV